MTVSKPIKLQNSLQQIIQTWKDQIICFSPQGSGYSAYFVDKRDGSPINYIQASCDELRHLGTNYNSLLNKIKDQYYGYLKEAVLNTIKYEATRRVVRKQHEWIQSSYKLIIAQKELNLEQQSSDMENLKQIISSQKLEIAKIKQECRGQLAAIQAEAKIKQKEAEIEQKNSEIARLNQQLQACDREITSLKSELSNGLQELKLKYKGLITQLIISNRSKHQTNSKNKSLQACQNIFIKAQRKINVLQCENKLLKQENIELQGKVKMLRI
ncbi:MAG: hypothetical protein AAF383_04210 [Cyanobacteria bacterium P01_A01_bin.83]